ncbi:MAG: DUF4159 domain-containing protein, partial [Alphaproteobacteria bacterium]|nr:DUF4159 domain-containing protein [Alphaproteobacteria bacterium]
QRLVALGQGVAGQDAAGLLAPIASLDGFGRVVPPLAAAVPASAETLATKPPSPRQPPGFYGKEGYRLAYNATSGLAALKPLGDMPSGVVSRAYAGDREVELKRWLILAALMLIFVDLLASFALRGLIRLPLVAASLLLLLAPLWPGPARADDAFVKAATQNTRLAYVRTGLADVDRMSLAGLVGLSDVLARRTSVESDQPLGVDVESDDLMFFPLLYWPIVPEQRDLSPRALAKIDAFMKTGGTILFDTRDQAQVVPMGQGGGPGAQRLRRLLNRLDIPPLRPVPPDHVLTKAFYLMQEFPGRHAGGALWVERYAEGVNDGVSGLIVGANDWAAAWAIDAKGNHLAAVVPGGERQREMAYRFGINLVMYVLTGNYKADQVHVPAILERLGQ